MDMQLFLTLVAGHFLADYGLQSRYMATTKAKAFVEAEGFFALTAHAAIHGLVLGLLAGSFALGTMIAASHWLIDFLRSSEWLRSQLGLTKPLFNITIDQFLHIVSITLAILVVV